MFAPRRSTVRLQAEAASFTEFRSLRSFPRQRGTVLEYKRANKLKILAMNLKLSAKNRSTQARGEGTPRPAAGCDRSERSISSPSGSVGNQRENSPTTAFSNDRAAQSLIPAIGYNLADA